MMDREKVISNLEQQIRWIEEIKCHQFPGWLNVTNAMRDAIAMLKEQDADAGIMQRCRDGSTVKYLGKGVVVLNYQWWVDLLKKRGEFSTVPTKEELLKAQEARKGHWIEDETETYTENHDTWECSECHEPFTLTEGTPEENKFYFCPRCGADMR